MNENAYNPKEERMYRLTVRTLYIVALILNTVVIYEQVKDTPEAEIIKTRVINAKNRSLKKLNERAHFRRHANRVIYEATTIVESSNNDHER